MRTSATLLFLLLACGPSGDDDGVGEGGTAPATTAGTTGDADADDGGATMSVDATTALDATTVLDATAADASSGTTGEPGEPAPGEPGGLCVITEAGPACSDPMAICNADENYCYLPDAPCEGFACGGSDRGTCTPVDGLPACTCMPGFENETFALYCCPVEGGDDPYCA